MTIEEFSPPGGCTDFDNIPSQRKGWSKYISATIDRAIKEVEKDVGSGKSQFYNETKVDSDSPEDEPIIWDGFPHVLTRRYGRAEALRLADQLVPETRVMGSPLSRVQDEYCEWRVTPVPTAPDKILKVTFTCEGPEYWQALAGGPSIYDEEGQSPSDFGATGDSDLLVQLYRELLGDQTIQKKELFYENNPTVYNPWNVWNTSKGIVHLQQINNTLGAEINIGAQATVRRIKGGAEITEVTRLICCGGFGVVERSSDPRMGIDINTRARQGFALTLRNPIGIYFASFNNDGITKPGPNNTQVPAGNYWTRVRGAEEMPVRVVYEIPVGELGPDGKQLTVSDLQIAGASIQFGGQLAERVKMKFVARRCREKSFNNSPKDCISKCCSRNGVLNAVELTENCADVFPAGISGVSPMGDVTARVQPPFRLVSTRR